MKHLCILGEVLFDHFPDGNRVLGGAPFNVAWHLQAFGQSPCFISRVGSDVEGDAVRKTMQDWGMSTDTLQLDELRPTGRVTVSFTNGEPEYDIEEHSAYDAIAEESTNPDCSLLYHGSLALRESTSRQTAEHLKANSNGIVFMDVNLRPPWWELEQLQHMLNGADWVKLNRDELDLLEETATDTTKKGKHFLDRYKLQGLVITHGADGAELLTATSEHLRVRPEQKAITIVDTVGAGDAFASVIILGLINAWPMETTLERAQDFASGIVTHRGATVRDPGFYRAFIESWKLDI